MTKVQNVTLVSTNAKQECDIKMSTNANKKQGCHVSSPVNECSGIEVEVVCCMYSNGQTLLAPCTPTQLHPHAVICLGHLR